MRCNNCGKEIGEYEIFCDECKKNLKKSSSREDVNELERLIENQKKLNDLEATKELVDLENLVAEELEKEKSDTIEITDLNEKIGLENDNQIVEPIENSKQPDDKKIESREERKEQENELKNKKDKKKLIIIISCVVAALVVIISLILILKPNKKEDKIEINYKKIINDYGKSVKDAVTNYMDDNEEAPAWSDISKDIKYKDYKVVCQTHNIYIDGNIYLAKCKVNGESTKYTYGKEQEDKETKKLTIYESNGTYNTESGREVGKITCKTEVCSNTKSYDTYSIIKEDDGDYIYNYKEDSRVFGPFKFDDELSYGNRLYAVMYRESGQNNMYSLVSSKSFKNIYGALELGIGDELKVLYKYGYAILKSGGKYNFLNLKTGNISYSIEAKSLGIFNEDAKSNLVNMVAYTSNDKVKLYNSNGKDLLDGEEFDTYEEYNGGYLFKTNTYYKVCDSSLNVKVNSRKYDSILKMYKDFIVVINKNHLEITDMNDKVLATFKDEWSSNYEFKADLSGWNTYDNKYGIYLTVINKSIKDGEPGHTRKYYYIKDTKESGLLEEKPKPEEPEESKEPDKTDETD